MDADDIDTESGYESMPRSAEDQNQPIRLGWRCFSPNARSMNSTAVSASASERTMSDGSGSGSRCSSPFYSPSLFGSSVGDTSCKRELEREFGINATQTCIYAADGDSDAAGSCNLEVEEETENFTPGRLKDGENVKKKAINNGVKKDAQSNINLNPKIRTRLSGLSNEHMPPKGFKRRQVSEEKST